MLDGFIWENAVLYVHLALLHMQSFMVKYADVGRVFRFNFNIDSIMEYLHMLQWIMWLLNMFSKLIW